MLEKYFSDLRALEKQYNGQILLTEKEEKELSKKIRQAYNNFTRFILYVFTDITELRPLIDYILLTQKLTKRNSKVLKNSYGIPYYREIIVKKR